MPASESTVAAPLAVALLTGGQSRRMGRDKAGLPWRGATLLESMIGLVRAAGAVDILISGSRARYGHLGLACIEDEARGAGPLAGIAAVLVASEVPRRLILACDLPFASPELLRWLWSLPADPGAWVVPASAPARLEPLCAIYPRGLLPLIAAALAAGRLKITAALAKAPLRMVAPDELAAAGFGPNNFRNLNDPDDYAAARRE